MNKLSFLFLCTIYVLISITSFAGEIATECQLLFCSAAILLVGIPHGAIDHVLFIDGTGVKERHFYVGYVFIMAVYAFLWFLFPAVAIGIFLVVSAYHFGESQLTSLLSTDFRARVLVYTMWGAHILAGLLYYNHEELLLLSSTYEDMSAISMLFDLTLAKVTLWLTSATLILVIIYSLYYRLVATEVILREIFTVALIHIAFYLLPLLLGFTVYFVILHSFKVLIDEFQFLRKKVNTLHISAFILKLLPLTIVSIAASAALALLIQFEVLSISYVLLAIVLISLITLPHSIVMANFYNRKKPRPYC